MEGCLKGSRQGEKANILIMQCLLHVNVKAHCIQAEDFLISHSNAAPWQVMQLHRAEQRGSTVSRTLPALN